MTRVGKILRAIVGLAVLAALLITINVWYGDYQRKASSASSHAASKGSGETTQVVAVAGGSKVLVLVDGLSLRSTPSSSAPVVRKLTKNEQLILLGAAGPWLQLRDGTSGKLGYVMNDPANLTIQK